LHTAPNVRDNASTRRFFGTRRNQPDGWCAVGFSWL